jgi:hypothetical protein
MAPHDNGQEGLDHATKWASESIRAFQYNRGMNEDETTPLLLEEGRVECSVFKPRIFNLTVQTDFKCWCCWNYNHSEKNPLIRVCQGCKDPELQYIHQDCINSFITSLPLPRRPRSPRPQSTISEFLQQDVLYDCTRCRDPYVVEERIVFPLVVIFEDPWLRLVFLTLTISFILLIVALFSILVLDDKYDIILFYLFGFKIGLLFVSLILVMVGMFAAFSLLLSIWEQSSGKKRLHVIGVRLVITV